MKNVKITVMRIVCHEDLIEKYENPISDACNMRLGSIFVSENAHMPKEFCKSAWETVFPFVKILSEGGGDFYGGWMKNRNSAMISCNDGFRPVSFLLESEE